MEWIVIDNYDVEDDNDDDEDSDEINFARIICFTAESRGIIALTIMIIMMI